MAETVTKQTRPKVLKKDLVGEAGAFTGIKFTVVGMDGQPLAVDLASFGPKITNHFLVHGMSQKLGDEITGLDAPQDRYDAIKALVERLSADDDGWTARRGEAGPPKRYVILALLRLVPRNKGEDEATHAARVTRVYESWDKDKRKAAPKDAQIALAIAQVKVEEKAEVAKGAGAGMVGAEFS